SADSGRWRPATPLLTLRDGDTVEATRDAWVVIVLTGGRGSVRVDDATAPFIVSAFVMDRGPLSKGLKILEASFDFLSTTKELPLGVLGTRGGEAARDPDAAQRARAARFPGLRVAREPELADD